MSEYQYVAFRAVDRPVSGDDLKYMESQSSRAEVTPWSFDNEYNFGDFHGNALEMLRRGYDIHLHYANFGTHRLLIRLPNGLPDAAAIKPYLMSGAITFDKDKSGPGGALSIDPFYEPGDIEEAWDIGPLANRLAPIRAEILNGDLRPLYLAHLAASNDCNHDPETTREAPVPAGLDQLTSAQQALAEFYGLGDSLISAAARQSPALPKRDDPTSDQRHWLAKLPAAKKDA